MKEAIYVLGGLGVVVFFIVRQRRSDRFRTATGAEIAPSRRARRRQRRTEL